MEGKRIPCRIWLEVILPVFLLFNFSLGDDLSKCFFNASKKYDVNIHLLKAVAKAESGMNSYAVNINLNGKSKSYILKDRRVAERFVRYLSENDFNFDVGISQINIKNIKRFGLSPEDLLDPCKN
ncbi:transglycosylase SLT domain-containing protein, partial [Persephonella sp.]